MAMEDASRCGVSRRDATDRPRTPRPAERSTANGERRASQHTLYRREPVESVPWHLPWECVAAEECEWQSRTTVYSAISTRGRALAAAIPRNAVTIGTVVGGATNHQSSNCAPDREFDCGPLIALR